MVANPEIGAPRLKSFYVTFGVRYAHEPHPYWKGAHPDGWLTVQAPDEEAARLLVRTFIGLKWSMMYDSLNWRPEGSFSRRTLATITTNGGIFPAEGVEPPTPQFGESDAQYYGYDSNEVVCARIEGILAEHSDKDAIEALGYEVEHVHKACLTDGLALFEKVFEVDSRVMAGELDWSLPYECPVCETSIT
jgi:hypothetical protein